MSLRLTEEEYAELMRRRSGAENARPTPKNRPKYGNRRVTVDGVKFDSQKEADTYMGLLGMYRAGELRLLIRQAPFDLPGGIRYVADFVSVDNEGRVRVIDTKSPITARNRTYINKKKQMKAIWGIDIEEV